ncbi:MAG: Gfo/Idh/MocA family oxidoreductase [Bacteroidales bacterium]|nr:Gfo/Idh/MocA family oxidoreductase [Bacteroidales bacterium]
MSTRRSFLKTATYASIATIALPTILPSCVKWKGANDRLLIGHIGVGSRGSAEMKSYFLPHEDFRIVAVSDVFKSRRDAAAQIVKDGYLQQGIQNPVVDSYNDYREMLDRKDIDMVAITTPDHWHLPVAIHAVQSGKHVHVNKPLGLSVDYMKKLKGELNRANLHFNYGTQQRSYAFMKKAMEYIHGGALGDINEVVVWAPGGGTNRHIGYHKTMDVPADLDYDRWLGPAPDAPYTADRVHRDGSFFINDYSIGFLGGWGAHPLDVLVWGLKDRMRGDYSVEASGEAKWPEGSLFDNINIWDSRLSFKNGLQVHFVSQDLAKNEVMKYQTDYRQNGTLFIGSKGWMTLSRTYAECSIPGINEAINNFPKKNFGLDGDRGTHGQEFAKIIRGDSDSYMDIDDAILADVISHNTNVAIRLNKEVKWDATGMKIKDSIEGNQLINRAHRAPFVVSG